MDRPKIFCTVISTCPSSSCVMSILWYVGQSLGSKRPPLWSFTAERDHCFQQASKCNTSPQPEKLWIHIQQIVTTLSMLLLAFMPVSMGLPYIIVDMIASHTRTLGYFSYNLQPYMSECRVSLRACAANKIFVVHIFSMLQHFNVNKFSSLKWLPRIRCLVPSINTNTRIWSDDTSCVYQILYLSSQTFMVITFVIFILHTSRSVV